MQISESHGTSTSSASGNVCAKDAHLPTPRMQPVDQCPVCASVVFSNVVCIPDHLHGIPGTYSYVRCGACASVFQNPQVVPDDLALAYPAQYFTHSQPVEAVASANHRGSRDQLRAAILHYADGTAVSKLPLSARLAGRVLSMVPLMRRRARFGLIDALAAPSEKNGKCLEVGPGQGQTLRLLSTIGWNAVG